MLRRREQPLLLAAAALFIAMFCAAPLASLCGEVFAAGTSAFQVWANPQLWWLLARSLGLAGLITAGALVIGATMGVLIARADLPARRALWFLHAFPFFLPPFLLALGWFHVFGQAAPLGGTITTPLLFSEAGFVGALVLAFAPVASSLVAVSLLGMDASLEEAARLCARPLRVATRILLPAARPALVLAAVVVFALAVSELGVAVFLRVDVFPAAVFARLGGMSYAPGEAFVLTLPLIPVALILLAIERRFAGARAFTVGGLRGMGRAPLPLGRWRLPCTVFAWSLALLGVAPLMALAVHASLTGGGQNLWQWLGRAPWTSLATALAAGALLAGMSLVLGHAVARRLRGAQFLDGITMLAFLTPASVLGVGIVAVWGHPATRFLYGTMTILVIGCIARYAAIGTRAAAAAIGQSPPHMEDAAAAAGAGYLRRLRRIVLPINFKGLLAAWLLAMVFCLRDFEMAVLYYPPGREPLPVRLFTLDANGPPSIVAALALAQVALTAVVLAAGAWAIVRSTAR